MSAQPYGGFGYHTGFVQALAGQLRGEAQAEEIARHQQQVQFNQMMALNAAMAQQEQRRLAQEQLGIANKRADEQLALQRQEAKRRAEADAARQKLAEERLAAAEAKANKPKELTPYQEISVGEKKLKAEDRIARGQELIDLLDAAPTRMVDAPGWGTGDVDTGEIDHIKAPNIRAAWVVYHGMDSSGNPLVPMPKTKAEAVKMMKAKLELGRKYLDLFGGAKPGAIPAPGGTIFDERSHDFVSTYETMGIPVPHAKMAAAFAKMSPDELKRNLDSFPPDDARKIVEIMRGRNGNEREGIATDVGPVRDGWKPPSQPIDRAALAAQPAQEKGPEIIKAPKIVAILAKIKAGQQITLDEKNLLIQHQKNPQITGDEWF